MISLNKIKNALTVVYRLIRYNLKIIFANKFIYFLAGAFLVFAAITAVNLIYIEATPDEETLFWNLLVPGILVMFYPVTFGIQNDADNRILEIIFGIPNYRYKVQLLRFMLICALSGAVLYIFLLISYVSIAEIAVISMLYQLMFPIICLASIAFLVSTFIKDGAGTAVIMMILGVAIYVARDFFQNNPKWNIFLNPFAIPENFNDLVWANIVTTNRIYIAAGSVIALLYGLLNLQNRERLL